MGPEVLVDVECTCWEKDPPADARPEIIEIGMYVPRTVPVEAAGSSVTWLVRPTMHRRLSSFCTSLTTITQEQVDAADDYVTVLAAIDSWCRRALAKSLPTTAWGSWGYFDLKVLTQNSLWNSAPLAFSGTQHVNVKEMARHVEVARGASLVRSDRRRGGTFGIGKAVRVLLGSSFQGTHHRGIDDARNAGLVWERVSPLFSDEDLDRFRRLSEVEWRRAAGTVEGGA